ncbi:hypothetical protein GOP47_0008074 [Adiantum capillus-veneris]|uniref:Uncharacterized protein n=1 Tax=Adiantum capillus-veneris TaxID=13818 RepID=A0A9D4UXU7_ADICA|nr:hypothetical protein GOP47_0008074 [Adiantum capillus-veneris]
MVMRMWMHAVMVYLLVLMLLNVLQPCLSSLTPPAGNSLAIKTKTRNGMQLYRCIDGEWVIGSAYATLLDYDTGEVVGNYTLVKNVKVPKLAGTWMYHNNEGDHAESGSAYSVVTGKKISVGRSKTENDLPDYLALASSHGYEGALSQVSYIARLNTKGGAKQDEGYCEVQYFKIIKVPFQAEFHFWKQDLLPPSMPYGITVGKGRPIQAFYGTGLITFAYDGTKWVQRKVDAKMYDVPGGTLVGSYFTRSVTDYKGGSFCWQVDNPNGFILVGKPATTPLQVSPGCMPWSLNLITTSTGNSSMFGPYTYVQTVSTTGGLPPTTLAKKPQKGSIWRSPFSAIYWFYCN